MKKIILTGIVFCLTFLGSYGQKYTTSNAHSHNDYEQNEPFWKAYRKGFGSIEADVFLVNNDLLVAHEAKHVLPSRTLRTLYLDPIRQNILKNKGHIYPDKKKKLILLIDCKTDGVAAIRELIRELEAYPEIRKSKTVTIAISGNRPDKELYYQYPEYIQFDGNVSDSYSERNLKKLALLSASFRNYSNWNGIGKIDSATQQRLLSEIERVHKLKKPIRFWATPDTPEAWKFLMESGVDLINTDKIEELASFLAKP